MKLSIERVRDNTDRVELIYVDTETYYSATFCSPYILNGIFSN